MKEKLLVLIMSTLEKRFKVNKEYIFPTAMMKNELAISSLDYINLITILEEQYNFEFPDEVLIIEEDISIENFCNKIFGILTEGRQEI